jgi:hypothetical protein
VPGKSHVIPLAAEEQNPIRRMRQKDPNRLGILECHRGIRIARPWIVDPANGHRIEGRGEGDIAIQQNVDANGAEPPLNEFITGPWNRVYRDDGSYRHKLPCRTRKSRPNPAQSVHRMAPFEGSR